MDRFDKAIKITGDMLELANKLPSEDLFMPSIAMLIDEYGAKHGWTSEKIRELTASLLRAQEEVHETLGLPDW